LTEYSLTFHSIYYVILETIFRSDDPCQSTEGGWLVNHPDIAQSTLQ